MNHFVSIVKVASVCGLFAVLAACTVAPERVSPAVSEQRWQQHSAGLQAVQRWQFSGRLAVRSEDDGWQAALRWRQGQSDYEIVIQGPLGQGSARLVGDAGGVALHLPDEPPRHAADAELLLSSEIGWWVPLRGLVYWVRGLPEPGSEFHRELDAQGRLAQLDQQGWRIAYHRYRSVAGVDLPTKVVLEHPDPELRLRLVIGEWDWDHG